MLLANWNAAKAREHERLMKEAKKRKKAAAAAGDAAAAAEERTSPRLAPRNRFNEPTVASKVKQSSSTTNARLARQRSEQQVAPPQLRKTRPQSADPRTGSDKSLPARVGVKARTSTVTKRVSGVNGRESKVTKARVCRQSEPTLMRRESPSASSRVAAARSAAPRIKSRPQSAPRGAIERKDAGAKAQSKRAATDGQPAKSPAAPSLASPTARASSPPKQNLVKDDSASRLHPFLNRDEVEVRHKEQELDRQAKMEQKRASHSAGAAGGRSIRRSLSGSSIGSNNSPSNSLSPDADPSRRARSNSFRNRDLTPDMLIGNREHPFIQTADRTAAEVVSRQTIPTHITARSRRASLGNLMAEKTTGEEDENESQRKGAESASDDDASEGGESTNSSPTSQQPQSPRITSSRLSAKIVVSRLLVRSESDTTETTTRRKPKTSKRILARTVNKNQRADMRSWRDGDPTKLLAEQKREETRQRVAIEREIREAEENEALKALALKSSHQHETELSELEEKWRKEDAERLALKRKERTSREVEAVKDAMFLEHSRLERKATLKVHGEIDTGSSTDDDEALPPLNDSDDDTAVSAVGVTT